MNIKQLQPNRNNPRLIKGEKFKKLVQSIKDFPEMLELRPIVIDEDNVILGGNMRYRACVEAGLKEVPVKIAKGLSEEQKREFIIKDNVGFGEWDWDVLANEWSYTDLEEWGLEPPIGLDGEIEGHIDDDYIPEVEESRVKEGDIWLLGEHKLLCGDSTDQENINRLIDKDIQLVFSSPPYNMGAQMYSDYKDNVESREYIDLNLNAIKTVLERLKGYVFWNINYNSNSNWEYLEVALQIQNELNLKLIEQIIWNKKNAMPITSGKHLTRNFENIFMYCVEDELKHNNEIFIYTNDREYKFNKKRSKVFNNYWEVISNGIQKEGHQAVYPVEIPLKGIKLTTDKKDIVYDPFGGLGTTLIACEKTERICYTIELSPNYCDSIIERWEQYTNKKAKLWTK